MEKYVGKVILLDIPNVQQPRYRWIVRKRIDGRYITRTPITGILLRRLKLKKNYDYGKEKLLPIGSKPSITKNKTNIKKKRNKRNKTKRNKAGAVFPQEYKTDIVYLKSELDDIQLDNPNAFREVFDANEDINHNFIQFRNTYNTWEDFFNDIRNYYQTLSARQRLKLFSYAFLIYVLLTFPGPNRNNTLRYNQIHF